MIRYSKIQNKPRILRSLTGLTLPAFIELLETFTYAYEQALREEEEKRKTARQRQRGAGRKATIGSMADKLLFILFYFRLSSRIPSNSCKSNGYNAISVGIQSTTA